jgi:hypothetical protein
MGTGHPNLGLPDIDASLMVLTGLSQGGYLGKKLTDSTGTDVTLNCLVPSSVVAQRRTRVVLYGSNFEKGSSDSCLTINGMPLGFADLDSWAPEMISFWISETGPQGQAWDKSSAQAVGVVVDGQPSTSTLALTTK